MTRREQDAVAAARSFGAASPNTSDPRAAMFEHPLSFEQEQIWLQCEVSSDPLLHVDAVVLAHRGALDAGALRVSLATAIEDCETFRTTFREVDGEPRAVVHPAAALDLRVVDLQHLPLPAREPEAVRLAGADARRPWDLEAGPLLRFLLIVLSAEDQRLVVAFHRIAADRTSIFAALAATLPAASEHAPDRAPDRLPSTAEGPLHYRDVVAWQRASGDGAALETELGYWRDHLRGVEATASLPTDRPRPAVQSWAAAEIAFGLDEALGEELRRFAAEEQVPLRVMFATALVVLLARHSGDELQTIGITDSARPRLEFEKLRGPFDRTLPLRVDLSGDPTFRESLRRVAHAVEEASDHGVVPLHRMVRALGLQHDPSRNPLFQVMLAVEAGAPDLPPGWAIATPFVDVGRTRAEIELQVLDSPSIRARMRFATSLFRAATIEALVRQWQTLLESAVTAPDRPVGELPVLTEDERRRLGSATNTVAPSAPFEPFPAEELEQTITARFRSRVRSNADRPAVIDAHGRWTYGAFADAVDGIAAGIKAAARVDHPKVGVLAHQDAGVVAAILAALRAGAAYVPLDSHHPAARIRTIARDAEIDVVVVGDGLDRLALEALGDAVPTVALALGSDRTAAAAFSDAGPDDPASLLYTSGSTGEPKGVLQSHRDILHRVRVYTNTLHLGRDDRILLVSRPTFVASQMMLAALLNGAALCVVDLERAGFVGLRDTLVDEGVTVYHSTPTVFRELVAALGPDERLDGVRVVALGGEEVLASDFDAFRRHFPEPAIFANLMGSTEASLPLVFLADTSSRIERATIPAGYPAEETEVVLRDPSGRPTDFFGEVEIRSRFVARGYWKRPELPTAFTQDPATPGVVAYRSGDLGRRLPNGAIEFAGRRDRQVKVRGIRIEIAELERALAGVPGVRHVAVEARPVGGETRLVAYLEASAAPQPSTAEVRDAIRAQLPDYMLPGPIVWLDRLPRTISNKIDRRALPAPALEAAPAPAAQPHDDLEARLVAIWEDVLGRRPIGVDDDFFDLGGHSLLAVRLFDRIWRELGQRIPLSALLEGATIEQLARRIRRERERRPPSVVAVQPGGSRPPLFVVPGAGSRILYLRNLAVHLGPDQPIYALHETLSDADAERRIEDLAARYVAAMREVRPHGPYDLVGYSFGGPVAFEIAQQLVAAGEDVGLLALIDSRHPGRPRPEAGFHPEHLPRRIANQARIVRLLGPRAGLAYLRQRLLVGRQNSLERLRLLLERLLPAPLAGAIHDPGLHHERQWFDADVRRYDDYRPRPYPGRLTFLWAQHSQRPPAVFDARAGWAEVALDGFDVRAIPGSHLTVLVEPLAGITSAVLAEALRTARTEPGAGRPGAGSSAAGSVAAASEGGDVTTPATIHGG